MPLFFGVKDGTCAASLKTQNAFSQNIFCISLRIYARFHAEAVKGGYPPFTIAHYKLLFSFRATDSACSSPITILPIKQKDRHSVGLFVWCEGWDLNPHG